MSEHQSIVVLGGSGKTGRRVAERLKGGSHAVRAVSRGSAQPFDWNNRETWLPVVEGSSAVYITYQPDLAVPGAPDDIRALAELAVAEGVQRLVLLSGRGEEEAERCEQIIQQSGAEWTIVRASWFNQNFSESFLLESIMAGEVTLPLGNAPEPFIDANDIADVVVAALTENGHSGQIYDVTGPRLLTFPQAIAEIAASAGRTIHYTQVTPEEYAAGLRAAGIPEDYISLVDYLFAIVTDGRNAHLGDGVQRALGRDPRDFSDYVRNAVQSGVWHVPQTTSIG